MKYMMQTFNAETRLLVIDAESRLSFSEKKCPSRNSSQTSLSRVRY